jgi:hypothetical protein
MSKALIEKLLRSRESGVKVGERTFTIRRPTDADAITMRDLAPLDFVRRFVVGWDLVELDVIPGGTGERIDFHSELWGEWVVDHPELWTPLATAIIEAYAAHAEARKDAEKN